MLSVYESIFCKSGARPFHVLMQQGKCDDWKNFGSADWFFKMSLTGWSSVVTPITGKIYVGCQIGWGNDVYYFAEQK